MPFRRIAFAIAASALAVACGGDKKDDAAPAPSAKPAAPEVVATAAAEAPTAAAEQPAAPEAPSAPRVVETASGLKVEITAEGSGPLPQSGQRVFVHYTGTLLDGTKFDSSHDHPGGRPLSFVLGEGRVIKGWDEGIAMLKRGGKARLTVPPSLAYGSRAKGDDIPANSTLVFEVELVDVK